MIIQAQTGKYVKVVSIRIVVATDKVGCTTIPGRIGKIWTAADFAAAVAGPETFGARLPPCTQIRPSPAEHQQSRAAADCLERRFGGWWSLA